MSLAYTSTFPYSNAISAFSPPQRILEYTSAAIMLLPAPGPANKFITVVLYFIFFYFLNMCNISSYSALVSCNIPKPSIITYLFTSNNHLRSDQTSTEGSPTLLIERRLLSYVTVVPVYFDHLLNIDMIAGIMLFFMLVFALCP